MQPGRIQRAIDRGIQTVAPVWGAHRARARAAIEAFEKSADVVRRFEGASMGRQMANWVTTSGSMDSEIRPSLNRLRNRARDLTANNVWATSAVESLQNDIVGTGILFKPRTRAGKKNAVLEDRARQLFEPWLESKKCDLRGKRNGYSLMSTAARELVEAGEFLVRRVYTGESPVPFRLLFLEADHLDTMKDGWILDDGGRIVQGVEYDKLGAVRAYYLFRDHPGDMTSTLNFTSDRVPATDVLHVFEELRFGQSRGIPRGTPCMVRLRAFDEYENAEEVRKKTAACFVGFVHDLAPNESPAVGFGEPSEAEDGAGDPAAGRAPTRKFQPGTWQGLESGKTITFGQPHGDDNYTDFAAISLRGVAMGFGVSYERLTGDLRGVNFSSGRMGAIKYHALLDRLTWLTFIPGLLDGIWQWFEEAMALNGELPSGVIGPTWTPPRRPLVDPRIEIPAMVTAIRSGLKSRTRTVAELGDDVEETDKEYVEENERADAAGLSFDSDGRRPQQQPAVTNEGRDDQGENEAEDPPAKTAK